MDIIVKFWLMIILPFLSYGQKSPVEGNGQLKRNTAAAGKASLNPPCEWVPQIMSVEEVSSENLVAVFSAKDAYKIAFAVLRGKQTVSKGIVRPSSNRVLVRFGVSLPAGDYTLMFKGDSCSTLEWSSKKFSVTKSQEMVSLQASARRVTGSVLPFEEIHGLRESIDIEVSGESGNWLFSDNAVVRPDDGYEFLYIIGGHKFRQSTRLINYPYQSNNPVRIVKFQIKKGVTQLSNTGVEYLRMFKHNSSAAISIQLFIPPFKEKIFFQAIPDKFDPKLQRTQWVENFENFQLPQGQIWVPQRGEYTVAEVMAKGGNYLSKYDMAGVSAADRVALENAGKVYSAVDRPEAFLRLPANGQDNWQKDKYGITYNKRFWPNGPLTQAEAEKKADEADLRYSLIVNETEEGSSWVSPDHPMWGWYYTRLNQRMKQKWGEGNYFISHNYFTFDPIDWFGLGFHSRERHISEFEKPVSQWKKNRFTAGQSLSATNLVCLGVYLNAPDQALNNVFSLIYKSLALKKMGKSTAVFLFGTHEWNPNIRQSITFYPDQFPGKSGTLYRNEKLKMEPSDIITYAALGSIYCPVMIEWAAQGKNTKTKVGMDWITDDYWFPAGSTTDTGQTSGRRPDNEFEQKFANGFPHYDFSGAPTRSGTQGSNYFAFGIRMYAQTFGKVKGGIRQYCRYRIDGGKWMEPQSEVRAIVNAAFDSGEFVVSERKNGKIAYAYYAAGLKDNKAHLLEWEHPTKPGKIYREKVAGRQVEMMLTDE
jgi:hypothetical protein